MRRKCLRRTARKGWLDHCDEWYGVVSDLAYRSITIPEDRFPAIAGLTEKTHSLTGYRYVAGLWFEDLQKGLIWTVRGGARLHRGYLAPSWSWGSLIWDSETIQERGKHGGLYGVLFSSYYRDESYDCDILRCEVSSQSRLEFGAVSSGYLILAGMWRKVEAWPDAPPPMIINDQGYPGQSHMFRSNEIIEDDSDAEEENDEEYLAYKENHPDVLPDQVVWSLDEVQTTDKMARRMKAPICYFQIAKWWQESTTWGALFALILEPTGEPDQYRRIGRAEIPKIGGMAEIGWEKKVVLII